MMSSIGDAFRSFWHTMTSYDRHASHNSPYRTGRHVPLNQSRHAPLTSVATSALESRTDLSSPYIDEPANNLKAPARASTFPYSPGLRSDAARASSPTPSAHTPTSPAGGGDDALSPGEIQMQNFHDGRPPPPPVTHAWKRIDRWCEDSYPELADQLADGATANDLQELEHELDVGLPVEVRESLACHDGQERGGRPTGILFGCMLLDCEEIVQEWRQWRVVNEEFLMRPPSASSRARPFGRTPSAPATASSSMAPPSADSTKAAAGQNPLWRQELLDRQTSQPPRAVQSAYAHSGWIPLARDWGGNNLAVDLAPGPTGRWGQVIAFGRDFDRKYVVARDWASFLAGVADDLAGPKARVDEESGELRLQEFRAQDVSPPYLEVLRWRVDQKYGRPKPSGPPQGPPPPPPGARPAKAPNGIRLASPRGSPRGSPYGSPTDERGRSPSRLSAGVRPPAERAPHGPIMPSPLSAQVLDGSGGGVARVEPPAVRLSAPKPRRPTLETGVADGSGGGASGFDGPVEKLVEAPTPVLATDGGREAALQTENAGPAGEGVKGLGVDGLEEMKNVTI